jgi:hypothetical protein
VGGHDTPAVVLVVNPGAGVPQPHSKWRASERALQRAKEPRNTSAPLDEHGQIFFHDLCQDLLSGAVPLEVVTLGVVFS